jgi:endonuclease/exonuclease/phosphatase family metal-dependent hydrolase
MAATMKILTWNVHHCVGMDRKHDPARVAALIRDLDPDIVALQELEANHRRSDRLDQPGYLAAELGMDVDYHPPRIRGDAGFGNAVFTRHRLRHRRSGLLPGLRLIRLQRRGALWSEVEVGGRRLQVINTHFGLVGRERLLQARELCGPKWLEHPDCRHHPSIVCGDFNATPRSRPYRLLAGALRDAGRLAGERKPAPTWPSVLPLVRYDHLFVGHGIAVKQVQVVTTARARLASDHLPVLMEFELLPG